MKIFQLLVHWKIFHGVDWPLT